MNTSNYEKTIEHQFDSFCKTVLRNQARDIYDEMKRNNKRTISLELLTQTQVDELSIFDDYDSNYTYFDIHNYHIRISDASIAQALEYLDKKKQHIILLSFFLDMTSAEIASFMKLAESTIHYHKHNALKELKKFMEEHGDEI
ncbi:sigma-70 family RNA polymerase sigma factor [Listeria monocytogenes]|nr:sigma-70 family RNA polymerase sigma factor [Listeria monocytogenes]EAG4641334.1 sigma-70 family RNA polymerase sigma factor [Listeria monocytogenes]EHT9032836.1 sigma-70 family RNA polymerase sigma factor [Listeria monocytogenes]MCN75687.1 sigma-70 family RNA polymerase sigma factor [Listeria monocytogenes]MCN75847.1 sigma-70 family RNA polymerase sigma factor [Listeria monocytogenes]